MAKQLQTPSGPISKGAAKRESRNAPGVSRSTPRAPAGSRTHDLDALRERYLPRGVYTYHHVYPEEGNGALIVDVDGNQYLDFAGGIGTLNVGYNHPAVVSAIVQQAGKYTHTCAHVMTPPPYIHLARRLAELAPGRLEKKTFLVNSGAEAVENAIKIARASTGRRAVISFENSFHGRTNLALALTGKLRPYRQNFGPFSGDVHIAAYPYCYRQGHSIEGPCTCDWEDALSRLFLTRVAPEEVAAVIVEPVQGEGGFVVPPADFLPRLREICSHHGIVLIADEIQTGFGRTGRMFACEHYDVEPDLILMAKSLAGGLPLAAVVGKAEIMDAPSPGGLGGTYGGNPVACAAALAVLDVFEEERLVERARHLGEVARERMLQWYESFPLIGDVRGLGAMMAIELVRDRARRTPAVEEAAAVLSGARARGLILIKAGLFDNVIRLLMPLVTTSEQMERGLDILQTTLAEVGGQTAAPAH